jgi:hypothetical protein
MNGYDLIERNDRLYAAMIGISAGTLDKRGLARVFEECSQPIPEELA